jgi:hypothetical protein
MSERWPYGWISDSGTFTFAPSVTGYDYSPVPVTLTASGASLTIGLPGMAAKEAG